MNTNKIASNNETQGYKTQYYKRHLLH